MPRWHAKLQEPEYKGSDGSYYSNCHFSGSLSVASLRISLMVLCIMAFPVFSRRISTCRLFSRHLYTSLSSHETPDRLRSAHPQRDIMLIVATGLKMMAFLRGSMPSKLDQERRCLGRFASLAFSMAFEIILFTHSSARPQREVLLIVAIGFRMMAFLGGHAIKARSRKTVAGRLCFSCFLYGFLEQILLQNSCSQHRDRATVYRFG